MRDELKRFFDAYKASFSQGPTQIAAFYFEPCVTARMGVVRVNPTLKETEALFAEVDRQYRAKGFTQAEYVLKDFRSLGANSAMATVTGLTRTGEILLGDDVLLQPLPARR
jgi:hypothetical protein